MTGVGAQQQLRMPKIGSVTDLNQVTAVITALKEWDISECVEAISFNTTDSNNGQFNGTLVFLQQQLDRVLLHLANQHF